MAYGEIVLITIGYTASDAGSNRKSYPIKRKYKQTEQTPNPVFPSSYTLYSAQKYWMPYISISSSDSNYIEYTDGDEYGWSDNDATRPSEIPASKPRTNKYENFPSGHRIVFANEIYEATSYYFDWTSTTRDYNENPYRSLNVRKWKKLSDSDATWTQYWYHPLLRRFYTLENTETLQELPNFDEPDQSKWNSFTGDAADLNLNSFTFAQIRELISRGTPEATATALVERIDNASRQPLAPRLLAAGTRTAIFSVTTNASGQDGESTEVLPNLPTMTQSRIDPNTGKRTITDRYYFSIRPNNINYSNVGVDWREIDRVNNFPILDYRNNKLMKISFEFVVESDEFAYSSLYESCEEKLQILTRMANRPITVNFTQFDSLFSEQIALDNGQRAFREWAITDIGINSVQRTPDGPNGIRGQISRATVSMTIQEVRTPTDRIIFFPKIGQPPGVPTIPPIIPKDRCPYLATAGADDDKAKMVQTPTDCG